MLQFMLDHQGTALTMLGSFGFGALAHRIGLVLGWFKSPQGQAIEGDIKAAAPIVIKALADSGHGASPAAIQTINAVLAALPDADPAPVSSKIPALILACLLGAASLHADGTEMIATINPSASGTMFLVDHQGNLVKNNASLYGADLVVGLVSVSGTVASPTLFGGLGAGMVQDAELNSNRIYGKVMVGYWLFNAFCAYDGITTRIGAGVTAPLTLLTGTYKVLKTNF